MVPTTWNWGKNCLRTVDGGIKACAPLRAEEELVSCRWSRGDQLPQKPLKDETWMKDSLELVDRCWRIPKDGWYFDYSWLGLPKILLSLDYPLTAVFRQDPIFLDISWDCSFFFGLFVEDLIELHRQLLVSERKGTLHVPLRARHWMGASIAMLAADACFEREELMTKLNTCGLMVKTVIYQHQSESSNFFQFRSIKELHPWNIYSYVSDGVKWAINTLAVEFSDIIRT